MTYEFLLLTIFGLATYSFFLSRKKAIALNVMDPLVVHSQPHYHGLYSAMLTITPAIILLFIWSWFENSIFKDNLEKYFSDVTDPYQLEFYVSGVKSFVAGASNTIMDHSNFFAAVEYYETSTKMSLVLKSIVAVILTLIALRHSLKLVSAKFKARDLVEDIVVKTMRYASIFAIFITLGIVLSLLFETLRFFESVAVTEFLFGTHWSPQMSIREDQVGAS